MRGRRRATAAGDVLAPPPPEEASPSPLEALIDDAEQQALAIYRTRGLPVAAGHYALEADGRWTFLGRALSPSERWEQIQSGPVEGRRRFSALERIGALTPAEGTELVEASELLETCAALRASLGPGRTGAEQQNLLTLALKAGVLWRALSMSAAHPRGTSLKFVSLGETDASDIHIGDASPGSARVGTTGRKSASRKARKKS